MFVYLYFIENKIFLYCSGVWIRSDELVWIISGEIFIFRSPLYAIIDQHENFDEKLPNLIILNNSWFNTNSVPDGYIAGDVYGINRANYYVWVLLLIKLLIANQHSISDQKRLNLLIFLKNAKESYFAPATRPGNWGFILRMNQF